MSLVDVGPLRLPVRSMLPTYLRTFIPLQTGPLEILEEAFFCPRNKSFLSQRSVLCNKQLPSRLRTWSVSSIRSRNCPPVRLASR